jgi:hypothetical protein
MGSRWSAQRHSPAPVSRTLQQSLAIIYRGLRCDSSLGSLIHCQDWFNFLSRDPMDLLSMVQTWMQSDISDKDIFGGDLKAGQCQKDLV